MDARVLVPGKPDVAHLSSLLRLQRHLETAALKHPFRVIVVVDLMELPQVDVVRLHAREAVFQALPGELLVATGVFGHQEDLLPTTLESLAHELLGIPIVVCPSVVPEEDTVVYRGMGQLERDRLAIVLGSATQMSPAEAQDRDLLVSAPQPTGRDAAAFVVLGNRLCRQRTKAGAGGSWMRDSRSRHGN